MQLSHFHLNQVLISHVLIKKKTLKQHALCSVLKKWDLDSLQYVKDVLRYSWQISNWSLNELRDALFCYISSVPLSLFMEQNCEIQHLFPVRSLKSAAQSHTVRWYNNKHLGNNKFIQWFYKWLISFSFTNCWFYWVFSFLIFLTVTLEEL